MRDISFVEVGATGDSDAPFSVVLVNIFSTIPMFQYSSVNTRTRNTDTIIINRKTINISNKNTMRHLIMFFTVCLQPVLLKNLNGIESFGWRRETGLSPPVKYFTDRSKAVLLLWIFYVCFCLVFAMPL